MQKGTLPHVFFLISFVSSLWIKIKFIFEFLSLLRENKNKKGDYNTIRIGGIT